jgi:hypothetical protein
VSWDGRVSVSKQSAASVAVPNGFEAELFSQSDAVIVDVSPGGAKRLDAALVVRASGEGDAAGCFRAGAGALGCALAGAGARARTARLELAKRLRDQSLNGAGVIYAADPGAAEVFEVWDGAASMRRCGQEELDSVEMLGSLARDFGVRRLGLYGGGSLLGSFLRAGCVDELWLTFCPQILGNNVGETLSGPVGSFLPASVKASLFDLKLLEGECFTKWKLNSANNAADVCNKVSKRVLRKS